MCLKTSSVYQLDNFDSIFVLKYDSIPTLDKVKDLVKDLEDKTKELKKYYLIVDVLEFEERPNIEQRVFIKKKFLKISNLACVTYITDIPETFKMVPQFVHKNSNIKGFSVSKDYDEAVKNILEFQKMI